MAKGLGEHGEKTMASSSTTPRSMYHYLSSCRARPAAKLVPTPVCLADVMPTVLAALDFSVATKNARAELAAPHDRQG